MVMRTPLRLEMAVPVAVALVLLTFLLSALSDTYQRSEQARVEQDIAALRLQIVERLTTRELYDAALPNSDNPLDWVLEKSLHIPSFSYQNRQEKNIDTETESVRGQWFFHEPSRELRYRFNSPSKHLVRLKLVRQAEKNNPMVLRGVSLQRLDTPSENP